MAHANPLDVLAGANRIRDAIERIARHSVNSVNVRLQQHVYQQVSHSLCHYHSFPEPCFSNPVGFLNSRSYCKWKRNARRLHTCSAESRSAEERGRKVRHPPHYLLKSFSVFRSSTTYASEARSPLPQRTGARSEISSFLQTGNVKEPSPIHACSTFTSRGTFSTSS